MIHCPSFWKGFCDTWRSKATMAFWAGVGYGALIMYIMVMK